jgi:hypothetical protein
LSSPIFKPKTLQNGSKTLHFELKTLDFGPKTLHFASKTFHFGPKTLQSRSKTLQNALFCNVFAAFINGSIPILIEQTITNSYFVSRRRDPDFQTLCPRYIGTAYSKA